MISEGHTLPVWYHSVKVHCVRARWYRLARRLELSHGTHRENRFHRYRRTNVPWALAISQNLTHNGFDVFFDYTGLASGDFETVILENIHARAHFLVVLTADIHRRPLKNLTSCRLPDPRHVATEPALSLSKGRPTQTGSTNSPRTHDDPVPPRRMRHSIVLFDRVGNTIGRCLSPDL